MKPEVITVGAAVVKISPRPDGRWSVIFWKDGKRVISTAKDRELARERARKEAKAIGQNQARRVVTHADVELLDRLRALAGEGSVFTLVAQVQDLLQQFGSMDSLQRMAFYYKQSGMADVERVKFKDAYNKFIDLYDKRSPWTLAGIQKELKAFRAEYPDVWICDLSIDFIEPWLRRGGAEGRYFNNRLASWKTFFNRCRVWNYWPKGEKHPGETIARDPEPDKVPAVWTPEQAEAILKVLPQNRLPYVVIGCWLGLRPISELMVIRWEHFDWEAGYLHVPPSVARKTMRERFVPIEPNVAAMLAPWRGARGLCCRAKDREEISKILKDARIIDRWEQDVMRHSYISYQLAKGVGIGQVAEWAGNSEAKIRKNYRRPLKKQVGSVWSQVGITQT